MPQRALVVIATAMALLSPAAVCAQFVQQGPKLVGTGGGPIVGTQGSAVALSADGNTAIVGGPTDNRDIGAAWIFTRHGATWTQQGSKLVGSGVVGTISWQGGAVAISADGNTAIVGGSLDNYTPGTPTGGGPVGAAWIFVRSGDTWTQQGAKLVGTGGVGFPSQGTSVAISGDGNTVLVGGYGDNSNIGAVWVFTRSGATWSQQGSKLVGTGVSGPFIGQGVSVALSSDGNTALVGGPGDGGNGAVWVFTRSGDSWTQQGEKVTAATGPSAWFGGAVALSADGNTAAIGAPGDTASFGAAWIFTRHASTWTQQGTKLLGSRISGTGTRQGTSVSLSANGNTLIVGGPNDGFVPDPNDDFGNTSLTPITGASWIFTRNGTAWSQSGGKLVGQGSASVSFDSGRYQGTAVAISARGQTAIVGKPNEASTGSVWIFTRSSELLRAGDTDGDTLSDITVYNTTSGVWSSLTSASSYSGATNVGWGGSDYAPVPSDYDGDGKADLGLYQQSSGNWYVLLSSANFTTALSKNVGGAGWTPVPADYDGDGKTDFVVYNTSSGQWYGLKSGSGYTTTVNITFGGAGYQSVPCDFDGDGRADIGVYQIATGNWSVLLSSTAYASSVSINVGGSGYVPVQADYDGDGKADFVVYNTTTGLWYGLLSSTGYTTTIAVSWGGTGYAPVKGDYDGDGRADLAVYQSSSGNWYILLSSANYTTTLTKNWGGAGYAAVPQHP